MQLDLTPEEELACSANQPLFYKVIKDMIAQINDLEQRIEALENP
jgi:hypothetical protein